LKKLLPLIAFTILLLVPVGAQNAFAGVLEENSVHAEWQNFPFDTQFHEADKIDSFSSDFNLFDLTLTNIVGQSDSSVICTEGQTDFLCQFFVANFVDNFDTKIIDFEIIYSELDELTEVDVFCFKDDIQKDGEPVTASSSITSEGVITAEYQFECHPNPDWEVIQVVFDDMPSIQSAKVWTVSFDEPKEVVGGEFLPIDSTALVLVGLQTSAIWMLPVLAGVAGSAFGILYIKSRRN